MSTRPSAALPGRAAVRFGVGTTFVYDGETVTIVEMTATGYGNDVRVTDRGGQRCYWLSARELLASGRAHMLSSDEGPHSDDDVEIAGTVLANLTEPQRSEVAVRRKSHLWT
jgi:hypothetical protein